MLKLEVSSFIGREHHPSPQTLLPKDLTIESEVAKEGSQEVHEVHDGDGDVGDALHLFL